MPSVQIFFSGSMQDRARSYTSCTIRDQDEQLRAQQQAVAEDPIFAAIERHKTASLAGATKAETRWRASSWPDAAMTP